MQGGQIQFTYNDLLRMLRSLGLIPEEVDSSHKEMDNFMKFVSHIDISSEFIPPVDISNTELPMSVKFEQLLQTIYRLAKKPVLGLYIDVFDQIYLSSKKRNVSISGPHLLYLFKEDDRANSGQISLDLFITRVSEKILG
jgi:hypothetical protein